jgi:hypothetical protein
MLSHLFRAFFMANCFSSLWIVLLLLGHGSPGHSVLGGLFLLGMLLFAASPFFPTSWDEKKKFGVMSVSWLVAASIGIAWLVRYEMVAFSPPGNDYRRIHGVLSDGGYWWYFFPSDPDSNIIGKNGLFFLVVAVLVLFLAAETITTGWKRLKENRTTT